MLEQAFAAVDLDWQTYVETDLHLLRPAEPLHLVGDATKARTALGWEPETPFADLIREMTLAELQAMSR